MSADTPKATRRSTIALAIGLVLALGLLALVGYRIATRLDPAPPMPDGKALEAIQDPPEEDLSRFYTQQLQWDTCNGVRGCARLTVPADYDDPGGEVTTLQVVRSPAGNPDERIDSLIVAPGGPGLSAVDFSLGAPVTDDVAQRFDIVGMDRRGTGRSTPLHCLGDVASDVWLGTNHTPDTRPGEAGGDALAEYAQACQDAYPGDLDSLSSRTYAKDLDVLRSVLGEEDLHLLGYSYGTYVGQWYMQLFPDRVGRFVLDGVVPIGLSNADVNAGQALGFKETTTRYLRDCVNDGDCPLGDSLPQARRGLVDFLAATDTAKVNDDPRVRRLTSGWRYQAVLGAMYTPARWDELTGAIRSAQDGDGDPMMAMASAMVARNDDGTYRSNVMQVLSAVSCVDRSSRDDLDAVWADTSALAAKAPVWGTYMGWQAALCVNWPVEPVEQPDRPNDPGVPVLVVGTTGDPATPHRWSQRLAGQLDQATLLTFQGRGHTAYRRDNCIDDAVDAFLLTGDAPDGEITCTG